MSIISQVRSSRQPKYYARPTPKARPSRRAAKPPTPFGVGILDPAMLETLPVVGDPTACVLFREDEFWFEREAPSAAFRYWVALCRGGVEVESRGFDSRPDAEAYARCLAAPFEPSEEDRRWWAIESEGPDPELTASGDWTDPSFTRYPDEAPELSDDFGGAFGMGGAAW